MKKIKTSIKLLYLLTKLMETELTVKQLVIIGMIKDEIDKTK